MLDSHSLVDTGALDLIAGADDAVAQAIAALVRPGSGINVIPESIRFIGRVGDGENPNTAQSAIFTGLELVSSDPLQATIFFPEVGLLLTSGVANLPSTNTDESFDPSGVGVAAPDEGAEADKADLTAILQANGLASSVTNVNFIEFSFTVASNIGSIEADFVFGSEEFPNQSVTDLFAFIVDGTNYAVFPDGSLVAFIEGANADNFTDNLASTYAIEYDGLSKQLHVAGLLDPAIGPGGVHTIKIAIANTSDTVFDSGVFIGNLVAGTSREGGIVDPPDFVEPPADAVPIPEFDPPAPEAPVILPTPGASPLLVLIPPEPPAVAANAEYGTNGYLIVERTDYSAAPTSPAAIDAALAADEIDEAFLLAGFLDFVDPEMLVVDLGDEPPAQIAHDAQRTGDGSADEPASADGQSTAAASAGAVEYLKPPLDNSSEQAAVGAAGQPLLAMIANNWRLFTGVTGGLLLAGAAWKSRYVWLHAARKLWVR